jgi:hypothetical protein
MCQFPPIASTRHTYTHRHGIYFHNAEQEAAAKEVMKKEQEKYARPIVTECLAAQVYWPAEVRCVASCRAVSCGVGDE